MSDSVTPVLNYSQNEWYSGSFFDHIHPDDIEKVREQLSTQEPANSGRILDLKTGTVKKEGHQCKSDIISQRSNVCYKSLFLPISSSINEIMYGLEERLHLSDANRPRDARVDGAGSSQ